nr:thiamine pyrophosphate-binding protein [Rhizobium sp. G21]
MISTGMYLTRLLEAYGVDTVFGIPGVHTVELYRGLAGSSITHITPGTNRAPASWPTVTPASRASRASASSSPARA